MTISYCRFPAAVDTSDGTHLRRSAVVVIDGTAYLAVQGPRAHHEAADVQVIATLEGVTVNPQERRQVILTGADGQTWTVSAGDGCGCGGSSLRAWYDQQLAGQSHELT